MVSRAPGETNPARREAQPRQECPRAGFPGRKFPGKLLWYLAGVFLCPHGAGTCPRPVCPEEGVKGAVHGI